MVAEILKEDDGTGLGIGTSGLNLIPDTVVEENNRPEISWVVLA